ncbi:hypothetical protein GCM10009557_13880 [Virgisporangium ochraceum]|uniref:Uncharacterized protein n=1 Tax=Virgisporangium ochraceum TaxID=65505 RepID=A0A8J4EGL6_9ACTN|nr:hypothetical protein [Virgisporangium ochraceum]GIJ71262.1 hypothetical protein Voc01_061790 [Virgisporangium ochraceum]
MGKNLPTTTAPAVRVVYYPQPVTTAPVVYTPQQLIAQREERVLRYMQWRTRQLAIQEQDRRTRRTLIRIGAVVLAVVLLAAFYGCWLVYQLVTGLPVGDIGVGLLVLLFLLGVGGSCGCVTIVQHFH